MFARRVEGKWEGEADHRLWVTISVVQLAFVGYASLLGTVCKGLSGSWAQLFHRRVFVQHLARQRAAPLLFEKRLPLALPPASVMEADLLL